MNRYSKIVILLIIIAAVFALTSCRPKNTVDIDIRGVWSGTIESNRFDARGETLVLEFYGDGSMRMGDPDNLAVFAKVHENEIDFLWSIDEYYLEITAFTKLYYLQFYYNLLDENTLEIILLQRNFINDSYELLNPGDRILLTKEATGFTTLMGWD
ncbi:MAG TPA: hypothetical protein DCO79_11105 [Spirochaeta sp.]|nr:hypothetical protein [Spirochaeta sp.]